MEKINIEKYEGKSVDYIATKTAFKVNEIIDWIEKIAENQVDNEAQNKDRLKTLEDKVRFIMENSVSSQFGVQLFDNFRITNKVKSLQDLWDEENKMTDKSEKIEEENWNEMVIKINDKDISSNPYIVKVNKNSPFGEGFAFGNINDEMAKEIIEAIKCYWKLNKDQKIEEDFYQEQNKRIREQIRDLKIQNANLDDYFINNREEVVKGRPDVKTGRLYGLDCGYIDGSRDKKIEEIISELNEYGEKCDWDWTFHGDSLESWLRNKLNDICK